MDIRLLHNKELQQFIASPHFKTMPVIPITTHRAISYLHNPALQDDDVLLLLAYIDETLVGYLGVLPDNIWVGNNTPVHCGWMSCLWVSENHRGKGIAHHLLNACFAAWNNKLIATEFTQPAKALYDKTNHFITLTTLHGRRFYLRSDLQYILPQKKKVLSKIKPVLRVFDAVINVIADFRFAADSVLSDGVTVEQIQTWDNTIADFIQRTNADGLFKRDAQSLRWITQYPWVIPAFENDTESKRYHFTATDVSFQNIPLLVRQADGSIIACLLLTNRNGRVKVPYCLYTCSAQLIAEIIIGQVIKLGAKSLLVFNPQIAEALIHVKTYALWNKHAEREYIISRDLYTHIDPASVNLQDGDGDCTFT